MFPNQQEHFPSCPCSSQCSHTALVVLQLGMFMQTERCSSAGCMLLQVRVGKTDEFLTFSSLSKVLFWQLLASVFCQRRQHRWAFKSRASVGSALLPHFRGSGACWTHMGGLGVFIKSLWAYSLSLLEALYAFSDRSLLWQEVPLCQDWSLAVIHVMPHHFPLTFSVSLMILYFFFPFSPLSVLSFQDLKILGLQSYSFLDSDPYSLSLKDFHSLFGSGRTRTTRCVSDVS